MTAMALWCVGQAQAAIRPARQGEGLLVKTLFSGISRGTERLVFQEKVPETEYARMRGPAQEGDFPHPVKYGYCAVGRVMEGRLEGQFVFALHPHQTMFRVPEGMLNHLPERLPPERAILSANMETALNILWDAKAGPGDKIVIVGTGVVGALTGYLAAKLPGAEVTLLDINPDRSKIAAQLGCDFATPDDAPGDCDVVVHLSASAAGLETAIRSAGDEATIVEASWYGTGTTPVPLGGAFHSRRLRLISSQVGKVPTAQRTRWSYKRRMAKALELLCDPALDVLISGETGFDDLPAQYGAILSDPETLCHRVRYSPT
ncbi:zinc-dependent alcohol dehydrogenase [Roseovarius rhodophyticola]|uniref:Zinc-binding alcohol dehydrogenase n=1 Tax=Roseovarius rhodophyticola TaxID=3080827 RepID=A0ABZ2TG17_9RHOB|nr:zinc-binding alcohol dehydrogenase [Roseovarius sp. W115]MDV2928941.1 zinc-binding alcohol dehydrogenase [Roseovarius sp. W115]